MNATNSTSIGSVSPPPSSIDPKVMLASAIVAAICLCGIVANASLVYVTAKCKALHRRCQLLIGFNSLAAIPTLYGISFKFFVLITGVNFIPLRTCYFIQLIALFGGPLMSTSLLCIGLDRLFSVVFPIWYKKSDKYKSFAFFITCCVIRALYRNALYLYSVSLYPTKPVMCTPGDMNQAEIGAFVYQEGLFFFWAEFACYVLYWLTVVWRRKTMQDWERVKKLMICLTVIMSITLFGSIQAQVYGVLLKLVSIDSATTTYLIQLLSSCLYAIADSTNMPVLFLFSTEYRNSFRQVFRGENRDAQMSIVRVLTRSKIASKRSAVAPARTTEDD